MGWISLRGLCDSPADIPNRVGAGPLPASIGPASTRFWMSTDLLLMHAQHQQKIQRKLGRWEVTVDDLIEMLEWYELLLPGSFHALPTGNYFWREVNVILTVESEQISQEHQQAFQLHFDFSHIDQTIPDKLFVWIPYWSTAGQVLTKQWMKSFLGLFKGWEIPY